MDYLIQPAAIRDADLTVPGDKSVSHRAIILGGIAEGVTEVRGFLAGEERFAVSWRARTVSPPWMHFATWASQSSAPNPRNS
jgi:hypothetical protein